MKLSRKKKRRIIYVMMGTAVVIICVVFGIQISTYNHKNAELEKRKQRLEELLNDEELRKAALEDEELYIKTKEFIEEKARSIGYVYEDEIIFKKQD